MTLNDEILTTDPKAEIPEELTLVLRKPITHATLEYTQLNLTEPTTRDLRASQKGTGSIDQLALLIQHNAKVPMQVVDQLTQRDLEAAANFFEAFNSRTQ